MADQNTTVKSDVRHFYDQIGWKLEDTGFYQNARYEDLRPVSREYIHRCHLRVNRHLAENGKFLLDAGSGPIQYPEYMTYSEGYDYRVCADLSITGLKEAQQRKPGHVLCVVADVANLPFKDEAFDGIVSLHTIHHVPAQEKTQAYTEIYRTLKADRSAVVVNGWTSPPLIKRFKPLQQLLESIGYQIAVLRGKEMPKPRKKNIKIEQNRPDAEKAENEATGTFIEKMTPEVLEKQIGDKMSYKVLVWRTMNTRFLRAFVHKWTFGKLFLRWLYRQEEKRPEYYGLNGQYPMIIIEK